jgi:ATP-binding cassette subfamily C protein
MSNSSSLKPFLAQLWRFDRRDVLIAMGLNLAGAMLEGLGLMLLLPLLTLAGVFSGEEGRSLSLPLPATVKHLLDGLPAERKLLLMLGLFVSLITLQATIQLLRERHGQRLQLRFVDHLRNMLFGALAQARWRFLAQHHTSEFHSVLTSDVSRIGIGTIYLLQLFTQLAMFPVYLAVAMRLSPAISGLAMLTGAVLWWVLRKSRDAAKQSGVVISRANQNLTNDLQEFLGALKLIKIHGEEAGYRRQFDRVMVHLREQQLDFNRIRTRSQMAFRIGGALALAGLTYAALTWAHLPTAKLLVLIAVFSRMLPQVSSIHMGLQQLWHMTPAFANWQRWVTLCETEREPPPAINPVVQGLTQGIQFEGVRYQHPGSGKTFSVPDLWIPAWKTTSVIGPSGSGKTTFLDLLSGLNPPQVGMIRIDGEALRADVNWRRLIAYITQENGILDGTLRDNLTWGAVTADDEAMWQALEQAAAAQFVRQLPNGLDTWVGERGVRLSGGERQRLALARALLRQPQLLILDEATSALDREHQSVILDALRKLHGQLTVLIVTHRHEEIRDLIDGQIQVDTGRVSGWQALTAGGDG